MSRCQPNNDPWKLILGLKFMLCNSRLHLINVPRMRAEEQHCQLLRKTAHMPTAAT